ncbi:MULTISPECIES: hypothetical protein [Photorhabdus]|uniref:Uncharacterized protein n=1 Tax=Photorhabdus bodei TaxID=2029681 RepID=A0AAW6BS71_9GAMM|nr:MULTISPECIES: hypothetical protein [Photorhabdus]MDB6369370.1 hypothetical protein [Photorhabdus bodei]MDB6374854.1 hypothetical protein [Photorhabdus bodei]
MSECSQQRGNLKDDGYINQPVNSLTILKISLDVFSDKPSFSMA